MSTETRYAVTGMTCDHCVRAVTEEVSALDGVDGVVVELVAGGTSTVVVTSTASPGRPDDAAVVAAIDEAGYPAVPEGAR